MIKETQVQKHVVNLVNFIISSDDNILWNHKYSNYVQTYGQNINARLTDSFKDNPGKPAPERRHSGFYWMMEVVMTTGAIKRCKAPVKSSPPKHNTQHFYKPDALPVAQSTVSEQKLLYKYLEQFVH